MEKYKIKEKIKRIIMVIILETIFIIATINFLPELKPFGQNIPKTIGIIFSSMLIIYIAGVIKLFLSSKKIENGRKKIIQKLAIMSKNRKVLGKDDLKKVFEGTYYEKEGEDYINYMFQKQTIDARKIFNNDAVTVREGFILHNYIPYAFITIGIFGTLFGVSSRLNVSNIQIFLRTSLYGIIFAIMYAILCKITTLIISSSTYDLALSLNKLIKSDVDMNTMKSIEELGDIITTSVEQINKTHIDSMEGMTNSIQKTIVDVGNESITNITNQFTEDRKLLESIKESTKLTQLRIERITNDITRKVAVLMTTSVEQINKTYIETMENITNLEQTTVSNVENENYLDKLEAMMGSFDSFIQNINTSNEEMIERLIETRNFVNEVYTSQKEVTQSLDYYRKMANDLSESINENMVKYNKEVNSGLSNIFSQYDESASKIMGNLVELTGDIGETINGIYDPIERINKKLDDMFVEGE